jgi:hypothetical protein
VFQEAILEANAFLISNLLFNIPLQDFKDFSLKSFSVFEDFLNNTPYTCFKDYNLNVNFYNTFLRTKVLTTPSLQKRFFTLNNNKLVLSQRQVKLYIKEAITQLLQILPC